jgi:Ca2+-binding RTX toxin-like protein
MKRISLLVTVALMLASALSLSGVAQAKSPIGNKASAKCLAEASKVLQPGFKHAEYTFHGGTESDDLFTAAQATATAGPDVFCGFSGSDEIEVVHEGDIFLGGAGDELIGTNNGTVYGQEGNEFVLRNVVGTFFGGAGNDIVEHNGNQVLSGTVFGGAGDDTVLVNFPGSTFDGGDGTDTVDENAPTGIIINVEQGDVELP